MFSVNCEALVVHCMASLSLSKSIETLMYLLRNATALLSTVVPMTLAWPQRARI